MRKFKLHDIVRLKKCAYVGDESSVACKYKGVLPNKDGRLGIIISDEPYPGWHLVFLVKGSEPNHHVWYVKESEMKHATAGGMEEEIKDETEPEDKATQS